MNHYFNVELAKQYGIEEAIIIENLYFWIKKNVANEVNKNDGRYWTYNSAKAFAEIFPYMSARKISRVLASLYEKDAILKGNYNELSIDRTMWYSFTDELISVMDLQKYDVAKISDSYDLTKNDTHLPKMSNGKTENDEPIPYSKPYNNQHIKEEKDKSFSKKDDFPSLAAEPTAEYCEKKTKAQIAQDIVDFWNANTTAFPKVRITSQDIIVAVDKLQKRGYSVDDIKKAILLCNTLSDFYKGEEKGNKWKATLQWLIKNTKDNFDLIMNGALHTSEQQQKEYNRIISASSIDSIHEDYIPELGDVFWSERNNMYAFIGDISDVYDGYTNENRPNGAKLFQNGYTFVWSSKEKRWIKP